MAGDETHGEPVPFGDSVDLQLHRAGIGIDVDRHERAFARGPPNGSLPGFLGQERGSVAGASSTEGVRRGSHRGTEPGIAIPRSKRSLPYPPIAG